MKVMKRLLLVAVAAFTVSAASAQEKTKTETFKVYGNCNMCEKRIEKAAKSAGAIKADWSDETQLLIVTFDGGKTSVAEIHKSIAAAGHDTEKEKASEEVYKKLPGCCLYNREQN